MKTVSRSLLPIAPVALLAALSLVATHPRMMAAESRERAEGSAVGLPVVVAQRSAAANEVMLPANLESLLEAPIYARTNGYLSKLLVDLGDTVKAGQPMAIIDAPEVDQELNQARAALEQATANLELAKSSATRWKDLGTQNAVAQQEVDEKQAAFAARQADVHAAEANVSRLTQLKGYQTIIAPFDGVVSARNVDVGALISAGGGGRALFRLAQTGTLRVFVNVPQTYFRAVKPGLAVDVLVNEYPNKVFAGKVTRVAGALDSVSRTLVTEVQVPNEDGTLLAGMFGQIRLKLESAEPPLLIPSNAAIIRADGTFVATVDSSNTLHLVKVRLGRDFGTQLEILTGIAPGTKVAANPGDAMYDGMKVNPILPTPPPAPAAATKKG
jgi:RND family efflux transporter MFP subunit